MVNKWISYLCSKEIFNYRLGLCRSVLALGTLLTLIFNDSHDLFTIGLEISIQNYSPSVFPLQKFNFFSLLPFEYIEISKIVAIIILLVIIYGWRPRYTCILHFWISLSFTYSVVTVEGGDQIISNLSFLLIPILLLDGRKSHWQKIDSGNVDNIKEKNLIANFFHLIIKLQVCFIYFHAAVGKMSKTEWENGTAVYYWFNDPVFGLSEFLQKILNPLLQNFWFVASLTWGTLLIEFLLFMAITMNDKSRIVLLYVGLLFHLLIVIAHGLFSFYFAMAGSLLLYLWLDNTNFNVFDFAIKKTLRFSSTFRNESGKPRIIPRRTKNINNLMKTCMKWMQLTKVIDGRQSRTQ